MKILSIIVPSYNTEQYIRKNIEYFLDKRLSEDVEIIFINDGSKDKTPEVLEEYCEKYKGYIRLVNKENGGHGSVINKGIETAEGKYFKVIDGDDWVETENLVRLVGYLKTSHVDAVLNAYYKIDMSRNYKKKLITAKLRQEKVYPFDDVVGRLEQISIHMLTIKTSILRENHIRVTENCFYDDVQYALFPVTYIDTLIYFHYPVYDYLVGQKTQSVSDASVLKNHKMMQRILFDSIDYYKSAVKSMSSQKKEFFITNLLILSRQNYNIYLKNHKVKKAFDWYKEFDALYRKCAKDFYHMTQRRYPYIRALKKSGKFGFHFIGSLLRGYKKLSG
ncbi:glycosyltransferase family 2 protein [Lachnospiraceae bacterium 48-21]